MCASFCMARPAAVSVLARSSGEYFTTHLSSSTEKRTFAYCCSVLYRKQEHVPGLYGVWEGRVGLEREAIIFWPLTIGQRMWSLRPRYLSDDLCTLITRSFNDLEVSRVGFGRKEKLAKLSDLVNLCKGEIFPCVVLPAKEPCMQTTIFQ
jgi:hypothetical protein